MFKFIQLLILCCVRPEIFALHPKDVWILTKSVKFNTPSRNMKTSSNQANTDVRELINIIGLCDRVKHYLHIFSFRGKMENFGDNEIAM